MHDSDDVFEAFDQRSRSHGLHADLRPLRQIGFRRQNHSSVRDFPPVTHGQLPPVGLQLPIIPEKTSPSASARITGGREDWRQTCPDRCNGAGPRYAQLAQFCQTNSSTRRNSATFAATKIKLRRIAWLAIGRS